MEKKSVMPVVAVALLGCIALMLSVVGGLYAYNTFLGSAESVSAQSDKGPNWSVTPVTVGGNQQVVVVLAEVENPYEQGKMTKQMAVYEIRGGSAGRAELYFVQARTLEYDFKVPYIEPNTTTSKWEPLTVKKSIEDARKKK